MRLTNDALQHEERKKAIGESPQLPKDSSIRQRQRLIHKLPAVRGVPVPFSRVTPKAIGFAKRCYANWREQLEIAGFAGCAAIVVAV